MLLFTEYDEDLNHQLATEQVGIVKDHRAQRFNDLIGAGVPLFQAYIDAGYDRDDLPF